MSYDYTDAAYDQLISDANTDDRVGHHDVVVNGVTDDTWPSGDPRRKIRFGFLDMKNAKADLTISPPPSPEVVKAESKSWDAAKKKGVAGAITIYRQLAQHYGTAPENIREGDVFRVNIVKTKETTENGVKKGGFLRVAAFLPKSDSTAAAATDAPPF